LNAPGHRDGLIFQNDDEAMKPWRARALPRRLLALFWAAAVAVATLGWLYLIYRIVWFLAGRVIA
jgi:hypothetical protein